MYKIGEFMENILNFLTDIDQTTQQAVKQILQNQRFLQKICCFCSKKLNFRKKIRNIL